MKKWLKITLIIIGILFLLFIIASLLGGKKDDNGKDPLPPDQEPTPEPIETILSSNAEILFVSNRDTGDTRTEIYSMDSNGNNQQRITNSNYHHFIIGIDNSKKYIVASRAEKSTASPSSLGDEDQRSLWIIDLEKGQETRLTDIDNHAEGDSFSPDGEWIVFLMKVKGEDQSDIYKIKKDGTSLTKLTDTKTIIEGDPEFSHDGTKIVFASLDGLDDNPRYLIKTMDTNGNNIKTIYDGGNGITIGPFPQGNYDPSWSPNDEWIVFERAIEDTGGNWGSGIWHILKVKRDGTEVTDLSIQGNHADRAEFLPSYSPDGNKIVFGSFYLADPVSNSHDDILVMDSNGGSLKQLTINPKSDKYPVWIK